MLDEKWKKITTLTIFSFQEEYEPKELQNVIKCASYVYENNTFALCVFERIVHVLFLND